MAVSSSLFCGFEKGDSAGSGLISDSLVLISEVKRPILSSRFVIGAYFADGCREVYDWFCDDYLGAKLIAWAIT